MKKAWLISDTHAQHWTLNLPKESIDIVIHAGDCTNYYDLIPNEIEFNDFLKWFSGLSIKNKIIIAGNHCAWANKKYNKDRLKDLGIIYLEHGYYELEGKRFFGSPYTPNFATWHFMKDRGKLGTYWQVLDENIDVLITHGPPKGILDLSHDRYGNLEYCGDSALLKAVLRTKPRFHHFGHIHNSEGCINVGKRIIPEIPTIFVNSSCVTDGKFNQGVSSHGEIIEI